MIQLRFESTVRSPADRVWDRVSTMRGVNEELAPLRMTYPPKQSDLKALNQTKGGFAFNSWLLLWGWLPMDRHSLGFDRLLPGKGFDERSHSWTQKVWCHRRRVVAVAEGTRITDELEFEPRMAWMTPLLKAIVTQTFERRHRRLAETFGEIKMGA